MNDPLLTIHADGSLKLHRTLTIGDLLQLLDAARNAILSMSLQSTDDAVDVADAEE